MTFFFIVIYFKIINYLTVFKNLGLYIKIIINIIYQIYYLFMIVMSYILVFTLVFYSRFK